MHMRENFVMARFETMGKVSNSLGHAGYVMGLLEYGVTDIILFRIFAIGCGFFVAAFQFSQPRPQWITVAWMNFYAAINIYQLSFDFEPPPKMSWEEEKLYTLHAKHISAAHFYELLQVGEWLWLVDGAILTEQGADRSGARLLFIMEGTCNVVVGGQTVAELGPGSTVGEVGVLPTKTVETIGTINASVAASGCVRCFSVPVKLVQERLEEKPKLRRHLERLFSSSLAAKAAAMGETAKVRNYKAVLEVACTLDEHDGISVGVEDYRVRHQISVEVHEALMEEIPQCVHRPFRPSPPPPEEIPAVDSVPALAAPGDAPSTSEAQQLQTQQPAAAMRART